MRITAALVLATATFASSAAFADPEAGEHAEHAEAEEHPHHQNHVAIFVGGTTSLGDESTTHFTLGADYEHRLPFAHQFGVGALVDSAIGSETETLLAGFVAFHPISGLMVLGAVGGAFTGAFHDGHLGLRGAAAYFFEIAEKFAVGPEVSFDRVAGENAVVYGLSAGTGF